MPLLSNHKNLIWDTKQVAKIIVLYDACVLYPAPLRDLLMHLAITDMYQAKWTNAIHDEWIRNVLHNRKDLPTSILETYGIVAQHPDKFLNQLIDLSPNTVCEAIKRLRVSLKNPPIDANNYLKVLEKQSLLKSAQKLRSLIALI